MTPIEDSLQMDGNRLSERLLSSLASAGLAASEDPIDLSLAVALGIRAAHLLALERLSEVVDGFPGNIQDLLAVPEPRIDSSRDAFIAHDCLGFLDALDILSDEQLRCIAPHLHRGWQDKQQSCREARRLAGAQVGFSVNDSLRHRLLEAVALYNRVFNAPAPVSVSTVAARRSLTAVLGLIERLVQLSNDRAIGQIESIRKQL